MDQWLAPTLKSLVNMDSYADCRVVIGSKTFKCHKLILGCASGFFERMFLSDFEESKTGEIIFEDVHPDLFQKFLLYIYTYNKETLNNYDNSTIIELLTCANKWLVPSLKSVCLENITQRLSSMEVGELVELFQVFHNIDDKTLMGSVSNRLLTKYPISMDCYEVLKLSANVFEDYLILSTSHMGELKRFLMMEFYIKTNGLHDNNFLDTKQLVEEKTKNINENGSVTGALVEGTTSKEAIADEEDIAKPVKIDLQVFDGKSEYVRKLLGHINFSKMTKNEFQAGPGKSDLLNIYEKYDLICMIK